MNKDEVKALIEEALAPLKRELALFQLNELARNSKIGEDIALVRTEAIQNKSETFKKLAELEKNNKTLETSFRKFEANTLANVTSIQKSLDAGATVKPVEPQPVPKAETPKEQPTKTTFNFFRKNK